MYSNEGLMTEFSIPIRIYIEDTDAGRIVYYVNYLKFMERSRTEFFRSLGYHKAAVLDDGLLFVVHAAQVEYRLPARLDDELRVTTEPLKLARTYVEFKQQVLREQDLVCTGQVRIACVDSATMKPQAMPSHMHKQLLHFVESQTQG
jgi:4-hydroxybenzoyl-CoA thioesterase